MLLETLNKFYETRIIQLEELNAENDIVIKKQDALNKQHEELNKYSTTIIESLQNILIDSGVWVTKKY